MKNRVVHLAVLLVAGSLWLPMVPAMAATSGPQSVTVAESASASPTLNGTTASSWTSLTLVTPPAYGTLACYNASYSYVPWSGTVAPYPGGLYIQYTPSPLYVGTDSFVWHAADSAGTSSNATCSITVTANHPPVAWSQNVFLLQNDQKIPVILSCFDLDAGQTLKYKLMTAPANGTLQYNNGSYVSVPVGSSIPYSLWYFTPNTGYAGTNTFVWQMSDGVTNSVNATCTLIVNPNTPPMINKALTTVSCLKNSVSNDMTAFVAYTHPDTSQTLTFKLVTAPVNGTLKSGGVALNAGNTSANNNWMYTPAANYTGGDSFIWNVNDGIASSANATVAITVVPASAPGAPPIFKAGVPLMDGVNPLRVWKYVDSIGYFLGGYGQNMAAPELVDWNNDGLMDLLVGEADGRVELFLNQGTKGHPVFHGGQYLTTQNGRQIQSWQGGCACGGGGPECSAPRVVDWNHDGKKDLLIGEWTVNANLFVYLNVGTDANPVFNEKLCCRLSSPSTWPSSMPFVADWNGDGITDLISGDNPMFTAPNGIINVFLGTSNDHGPSSIYVNTGNAELFNWDEYLPSDSFQTTTANSVLPTIALTNACPVKSRKSVAMVDWTGTGRKDLVVGMQDGTVWYSINSGTTNFPVFTNYFRLAAGGTNLIVVGNPAKVGQDPAYNGGNGFGNMGHLPAVNEARIALADLDGDGLMDLVVGDVNGYVTVFYQYNPKPVAIDQNVLVMPNFAKSITLAAKVDSSNAVVYTVLSSPTNGDLTGTAPNLTYTPHAGFTGPDSFTFHVADGTNISRTATVAITVANYAPVAQWTSPATLTSTAIMNMNTSIVLTLTATDAGNQPLTYGIVTPPAHGTWNLSSNQFTYTPANNYTGPDSFTYKANDGYLDSNVTTVNLDVCVLAVNFQPTATPVPTGFAKDDGSIFDAGRGYGWNINLTAKAVSRNYDEHVLNDTFVYSPAVATWVCTNLPNGNYFVTFSCGDTMYYQGPQQVVVQGVTALTNVTTAANGFAVVGNVSVTVTNGQLTVTISDASHNTCLNWLAIRAATRATGQATFVTTDTTTQGSWQGIYGADGYMMCYGNVYINVLASVIAAPSSLPSYALVSKPYDNLVASVYENPSWQSYNYGNTLAYPTTDARALQSPTEATRIACAWMLNGTGRGYYYDMQFTDGQAHQVALYCLAWNNPTWAETITILDGEDGTVLDTRTVSSFQNGKYLIWNLQGHVKIKVTATTGNATVSGLFFGSANAPAILYHPLDTAVKTGQNATFDVIANGVPLAYTWQRSDDGGVSWDEIPGANADSYTLTTVSGDNGAEFHCVVTNPYGTATSAPATLTTSALLPLAPVITSPLHVTAILDSTFSYQITALNNPTSFDAPIPPAFTMDMTEGMIASSGAAIWVGHSSGSFGHITGTLTIPISAINDGGSDTEILTITINPTTAPVITSALAATGTVGTPFSYQITANITPASYSAPGLPQGLSVSASSGLISGTPTSAFIGTTNITIGAGNANGTGLAQLVITINAASGAMAPGITTQPTNVTVTVGQTATFSVTATGTAPLSYQWRKGGVNIGGATSASYTTPAEVIGDNGALFSVVVNNATGSVTSANATLTVNAAPVAPTITAQPANVTVTVGQTATFSVTATGTAPLSYQWRKGGVNIGGATSASYTTPAEVIGDNGALFSVVVTNVAGSVTSGNATLTVNAAAVAPTITAQPTNATVTAGQTATFSVTATGTAPLSYQWRTNGVNIAGATNAFYTTLATLLADSGKLFSVVVTNVAGSATSSNATLTVNAAAVAPSITAQPTNVTVVAGQQATFNVTATGTAPLSYQWRTNAVNIAGATNAFYTTLATLLADSGKLFSVVVTNVAGSATSSNATLTVNAAAVAPAITAQPTNVTVTAGQPATFNVTATGTAPLSYQWRTNGVNIAGATNAFYTTLATLLADNGKVFSVIVSNAIGCVTSTVATLTVNAVVGPVDYVACWKLDETSGITASDSSTNGNTGTLQNGPVWTNGVIGGALSLDGVNDYVSTTIQQPGPNAFTASLWFKTTTTTGGKLIGFGDQKTGQSANYDRMLYMNNVGQIYFGCCPGGGAANVHALNTTAAYNDGGWHHAAGMVSSAGMLLYVDGVLCASNLAVTSAQAFTGYWKIGYDNLTGWPGAPTSYYFKGCLDDVRIYNRALSAAEVAALGVAVSNSTLVLYWKLDETNGDAASDSSGNANTGAVAGGALWETGKSNGAVRLDGVNGAVTLGNVKGMTAGSKAHSVAAWIRVNALPSNRAWILLLGNEGNGAHHWLINKTGVTQFGVWNGAQVSPSLPVGQWTHVVMTYDGTNLTGYVNGATIGSVVAGFNLQGIPLTLGQAHNSENAFAGDLDDVRVYTRVLSASDAASLAGGGSLSALQGDLVTPPVLTMAQDMTTQDANNVAMEGLRHASDVGWLLSCEGVQDNRYVIEYRDCLTDTNGWFVVSTNTCTVSGPMQLIDTLAPSANGSGFYRIRAAP